MPKVKVILKMHLHHDIRYKRFWAGSLTCTSPGTPMGNKMRHHFDFQVRSRGAKYTKSTIGLRELISTVPFSHNQPWKQN